MSNLLAARLQMAMSLGFHIIFAVIGIALPLMMVIAEAFWIRTGEDVYRVLARRWARGAAILFAVGAVSGTVLSFELGLLWPRFMEFSGPIIGLGFALEGFAFFTEAIFLGIYIYGWGRISPAAHLAAGIVIAVSGAASGVLVVSVNSWMNTPSGFVLDGNRATRIDPVAALLNPAMAAEALHMTLAAYAAVGLLAAGVHAALLRKDRTNPFHRRALAIALAVGGVASVAQPFSGDFAARVVARTQPAKLASMEGQFHTQRHAPLRIGGVPDPRSGRTRFALEIPSGLSILAYQDANAEVLGLNEFPPKDRPPVVVVHLAFQVMVACGMVMMAVSIWAACAAWRCRGVPDGSRLLVVLALTGPLGLVAIEAGWTVTEVGRQPWIIHKVMRTTDAVTSVTGLWLSLLVYTILYLVLGVIVVRLLMAQFQSSPGANEMAVRSGSKT
ncbi:MAG: cytochrome bd-type quinol oxidase, subunit 1 [Planctomycetota bacterium]|nr:cytochrome bd-type quinol oxidase, subunit 1 [Planctomycetota bacterium]